MYKSKWLFILLAGLFFFTPPSFANSIVLGTAYNVASDYENFNAQVSCSSRPFGDEAGGYYSCAIFYPDDAQESHIYYHACGTSTAVETGDSYRGSNCTHAVLTYYDPTDKQHKPTSRVCATTLWTQDPFSTTTIPVADGVTVEESCVMPPPPPGSLVCTSTDVNINHGTLNSKDYDGDTASGTGEISCSGGDATVTLSLTPSTIDLSNGTQSRLTLANQQPSQTMDLKENDASPFTVTSTLSASGVVPSGYFSGSTVIIVSVE